MNFRDLQTNQSFRFHQTTRPDRQTGFKFWPCGRAGSVLEGGGLWYFPFNLFQRGKFYINAGIFWIILLWRSTLEKPFKMIKPVSQLLPLFPWLLFFCKIFFEMEPKKLFILWEFQTEPKLPLAFIVWPSTTVMHWAFKLIKKISCNFLNFIAFSC